MAAPCVLDAGIWSLAREKTRGKISLKTLEVKQMQINKVGTFDIENSEYALACADRNQNNLLEVN